jgi:hypothetical protein
VGSGVSFDPWATRSGPRGETPQSRMGLCNGRKGGSRACRECEPGTNSRDTPSCRGGCQRCPREESPVASPGSRCRASPGRDGPARYCEQGLRLETSAPSRTIGRCRARRP